MSDTLTPAVDVAASGVQNDFVIDSNKSFTRVTSSGREVAAMYFYQELDLLIDLARAIAFDFFARPHLYDALGDPKVAGALARLHARSGAHEEFLSHEQRKRAYAGLFTEGPKGFAAGRDALLHAAAKFSERVYDTGEPMLRAAVRNAAASFKAYLTTLPGASLTWTRDAVLPVLTDGNAYRVLRDGGVRSVFGLSRPVAASWPYSVDGKGDELVEVASICLTKAGLFPAEIGREEFNARQRVALRGAEAIATVIDYGDQRETGLVDRLILTSYTWHAALIQGGHQIPHPIDGVVALDGTEGNRSLAYAVRPPLPEP